MKVLKNNWGTIIFYLTIVLFVICLGTDNTPVNNNQSNPIQNDVIVMNN